VYGFTGANVGQLPCLQIAGSVTAYGRNLLFSTRSFVESECCFLVYIPHWLPL
jgi:DNA polymerase delta subunit 1